MLLTSFLFSAMGWAACPPISQTRVDLKDLRAAAMLQGQVTAGDVKPKLLILDFWASWCGPCRDSLPFSEDLQKKFSGRGVRFVTVSNDEKVEAAREFLRATKLALPVLLDSDRKLARRLELNSIPALIGLNAEGRVVLREVGFVPGKEKRIEKRLAYCAGE